MSSRCGMGSFTYLVSGRVWIDAAVFVNEFSCNSLQSRQPNYLSTYYIQFLFFVTHSSFCHPTRYSINFPTDTALKITFFCTVTLFWLAKSNVVDGESCSRIFRVRQSAGRNIPEDLNRHTSCCKDLSSRRYSFVKTTRPSIQTTN